MASNSTPPNRRIIRNRQECNIGFSSDDQQNIDATYQDLELAFKIYKVEYEKAAERYENIYKAIWQIFSYMALLAGGILTFTSSKNCISLPLIIVISLIPLIFWFLAIYIPMDYYGQSTRKSLSKIEEKINNIFLNSFEEDNHLNHYIDFSTPPRSFDWSRWPWSSKSLNWSRWPWPYPWRVKHAVNVSAALAILIWFFMGFQVFSGNKFLTCQEQQKSLVTKNDLLVLNGKIDQLSKQLDKIEKDNLNLSKIFDNLQRKK